MRTRSWLTTICVFIFISAAQAQTSAFTYQGKLTDNGSPADGVYDFEFRLFDALTDGTQKGTTLTLATVEVTNGTFSVQLDFVGCVDCFDGGARFLEISVRPAGAGSYTLLTPRQQVTSTPYAIKALDATRLGGQLATDFIQNTTTEQEMTNFNIGGSGTVAGTLTGGVVNAATQYQIGGLRMLAANGPFNNGVSLSLAATNTFLGENAGINTTPAPQLNLTVGKFNSFVGANAGKANTTGNLNSFFGAHAGESNSNGFFNSFFGTFAGVSTTGGCCNSFFGTSAGDTNTTGTNNTMIGLFTDVGASNLVNATAIGAFARVDQDHSLVLGSILGVNECFPINDCDSVKVGIGTATPQHRLDVNGVINTTTQYNLGGLRMLAANGPFNDGFTTILTASNTFLGESAGINTTPDVALNSIVGKLNSFFGANAGRANTDGNFNSFFGSSAGTSNTDGFSNSIFGSFAGFSNTDGGSNSFFGRNAGFANTTGGDNSFFGVNAGSSNTLGFSNSFFGVNAGSSNTDGFNNTIIGSFASVGANNLVNATAIGAFARVNQNNSLVLGSINGVNGAAASVNVGIGTTAPAARLHVSGIGIIRARVNSNDNAGLSLTLNDQPGWSVATVTGGPFQIFNDATGQNAFWINNATNNVGIGTTSPQDKLDVNGVIRVQGLGSAGGAQLCRNLSNQISQCSSSLRYKSNIATLGSGFELINQLRPVTFDWKQGGEHDLGLVAEEVAKVEPLLVTRNERGEIEGVKYDRVGVVLINAVKEQKAQLENQQRTIERQQQQIEALKRLVCASNREAEACK